MDVQDFRSLQEAYMEVIENQQLDEISQKTSTRAYVEGRTDEFEGQHDDKQVNRKEDIYDIILSHLLDEGYADTNENALAIMSHMSEEWKQSIVEGSAEMSAGVPSGRTVKITAGGKEPVGDAMMRRAGQAISGVLGGKGRVQSTTVQPKKPLVSTQKPGPSNNFGRGF